MKLSLKILLNVTGAMILLTTLLPVCEKSYAQTETLEQRVARGDGDAFIEAANRNRYDLIPALEKSSEDSTAQMALARLGVKQYVDVFVRQLTDTTNSNAYAYYRSRELRDPKTAEYMTKVNALRSLLYINDKSTVRAIVSELDDTNRPPRLARDLVCEPPCAGAVQTLERMGLENAPVVDKVKTGDTRAEQEAFEKWMEQHPGQGPTATPEEHLAAWKKWWEQNKDKYP
jgi:hypothetical protein